MAEKELTVYLIWYTIGSAANVEAVFSTARGGAVR